MSTGKTTEFLTTKMLRGYYRSGASIQRLPDKYDTGQYEDVRPSDFLIVINRGLAEGSNTFFLECKETATPKTSFSITGTFRKGKIQGMVRAAQLGLPYFVVFNILSTKEIYLVPAIEILKCLNDSKKSISFEIIKTHPWVTGALHDDYLK